MLYIEEHGRHYICGIPGDYAIKLCGNNRIIIRGFNTLYSARSWLKQ